MTLQQLSFLDRMLDGIESALSTVAGSPLANRPYPAETLDAVELDDAQRKQVSGFMRINHTGEVCAQALYKGQALFARDAATARHLDEAADEETDHLAWCATRLEELEARPSLFNPLWYAGSYAIGATAAAVSDRISLGFVVETERQVEAHLTEHLAQIPEHDTRSAAILEQMREDEARHADNALARGGVLLPPPVPSLMRLAAKCMKTVAYRI